MRTGIAKLGSWLMAGVFSLTTVVTVADANTHVHTNGAICNPYNGPEALDIDLVVSGVRNIAAGARHVLCSVPRVTQSQEGVAEPWHYTVYGSNTAGNQTTCTLYAYSNNGNFRSSVGFTETAAQYASSQTFPGGAFSVFSGDYISLLCLLPASRGGVLRGFSAISVN
jgi:hypothetical protein